jgi:phosphotransferase system enzyme I (PtsP)
MGVPVVGRVRDVRRTVIEGDELLIDGDEAVVHVRPTGPVEQAFEAKLLVKQKQRAEFAAMKSLPAITLDGERLTVAINAGLRDDVEALHLTGADAIGLFRTEFQFLVSATLPRRESQQRLYKSVLDAAGGKLVVFRTIDIGGDKALPYLHSEGQEEENPAMGWRALRLSLDRSALMKSQARALLEAGAGREIHIMFPMVSEPWEFDDAKALVEEQRQWLTDKKKRVPTRVNYGAMLEVPALAEMLDVLLPKLDFLSIGTNDLTQFLFAADRAHPKLAERYDWLSPAILRFLRRVMREARAHKVPVAVCGEMGGRTLEAMALIGLGIRRLSITPAAVGSIKAMVRSVDRSRLMPAVDALLDRPPPDMRAALAAWARENGVVIG